MTFLESKTYMEDVIQVANLSLPWEKFTNKTILITGASGMVGSFLVDVLMYKNAHDFLNCKILAIGRNQEKSKVRFEKYWESEHFTFIPHDINLPLTIDRPSDFILHLASNTHPVAYSTDPIGTITTNVIGTNNLLSYATTYKAQRFLLASSVEIYGENKGDTNKFDESYLGYIDCNTLRAGYPESKRCAESLCQAYLKHYNLDFVTARLSRVYGPTMLLSDTKASSQFILKAVKGEDIILKSVGNQFYSYTYVADAVSGLFTVLLKGELGQAYNIADEKSDITLKNLAQLIANIANTQVVFDIPNAIETVGFSKATLARLEAKKLQSLSWTASTDIKTGMTKTIAIIKEVSNF